MKQVSNILILLLFIFIINYPAAAEKIDKKLWQKAQKIHKKAIVIDAHAHPIMQPATPDILDLGKKTGKSQVDFITMKEGGLDAVFYSMPLLNPINNANPSKKVFDDIVLIRKQTNKYFALAEIALSPADIRRIHDSGKRAILLSIESTDVFEGHAVLLAAYHKLGVRMITIAHTKVDPIAGPPGKGGGLSKFGEEVVREMNELGMLIDITHTSDNLQLDIIKKSEDPVIASHSCMRAINNRQRNIPDNILKEISRKGGAVMITFYPGHLSGEYQKAMEEYGKAKKKIEEKFKENKTELEKEIKILEAKQFPRPVSIEILIDHIDHAVKTAGIDYVGLGSDYVGPGKIIGLETAAGYPLITYHLLKRGYKEEEIKKILGENLLRVFAAVQKAPE